MLTSTINNINSSIKIKLKLNFFPNYLPYFFVFLMLIFTLFPIVWVFSLSLKNDLDAMSPEPVFIFSPTFDNYLKVFENTLFMKTFLNSIWITILATILSLCIAIPAAYIINKISIQKQKAFGVWLLLAYMLPEFLFIIPMYTLYQTLNLYDTYYGIALLYQVHILPFSIWMIKSFFNEIPKAVEEAAIMEGCSTFKILIKIYFPIAIPGIVATAILNGIWIWNELAIALGLSFSEAQTVTVGITSFRGYASFDWGGMTAASMCALAPMLLAAIFAQKHIIKGMTLGAVKG